MQTFDLAIAFLGGLVLFLGLGSGWLERSPVPPTLIALLAGAAASPLGLGWFDFLSIHEPMLWLERAARLSLGMGLIGVALRVPSRYPRCAWQEAAKLLGLGMPLMWIVSSALVAWFLGLPLWPAALVGAIVTPTDPVTSAAIVTGGVAERNVPSRLRHTISFESGANDGLAFPLVLLAFLMITEPTESALRDWFFDRLLWEVGFATAAGVLLGRVAGRLLLWAEAAHAIQRHWRLVYAAALALFALGVGNVARSDEVLLVFAAGVAFDQVVRLEQRRNETQGVEALNRFFAVPMFALVGMAIPWQAWWELGWPGLGLAIAVLLLRRSVAIVLLRPTLRSVHGLPDLLLTSWFAPIGVAAVYYSALVDGKLDHADTWPVVSLLVCASVVAHGITAAPLSRLYGRAVRNAQRPSRD